VVNSVGELLSGPTIESGASGFLLSREWEEMQDELKGNIHELIARARKDAPPIDVAQLRSQIRDSVSKSLRAKLQAKPTVQVIIHELAKTT